MPRTYRTVCPRNCYCTCGMLVTVDGDRIVRIEGDPENPATGGHVCLKGISYARRFSTGHRLLHPLRRAADGSFERVSWDAALSDIAGRLERVRRSHGADAALYYEGSGSHGALGRLAMAFWHQFGGCTLTYGDLCWPAGLEATRLTYGANLHNHPRLTVESRFILVWGHNPAETNVHQMRLIQEAQDRGARLALVDPRSTDTGDGADVHLQPRPGTDAALALGMARVIVHAGLHDRAFLAEHASGLEAYLARVEEYPLERVSAITGVPAPLVEALALEYGRTKPALLIAGFGLQRHHHAGQTMRAVALLPALTGNVGVAGAGWQYANLASHAVGDPPLPPEPPGVRRRIPVARLGPALAELDTPAVRAAWVEKGNPASQHPRSSLVREAFSRLDLLVVVDQFLTDTARLAHYVLPAKSLFEEEDVCTAYWHPYLQRRTKIFDPPGEVKTETEIWRLLSGRFGFDQSYFPRTTEQARQLLCSMLGDHGVALFEEMAHRPVAPAGTADVAFPSRADAPRFPTPSGRIQFASPEAASAWGVDPVPDYVPLPEGHQSPAAARYPLQLLSCKTRDRIHSQFGNIDWVRQVERPHRLDMHPSDAAARGLTEGDVAAVWNDRGRVELMVRLDAGLRPGVVHVLEGRCHEGDPDINQLTDAGVTDMNHGATFYECLVEIGRQGAGGAEGAGAGGAGVKGAGGAGAKGAGSAGAKGAGGDGAKGAGGAGSGFILDLGRCVGCAACVLACRLENGWTPETPWRRVLPLNLRRRPGGPTYFFSVACHHCERPACLAACPSGAYEKRPDGVVLHHESRCVGCRYCEMACPFGAPRFAADKGVMTKCHLCHERLDGGQLPACVAACPTDALRFVSGRASGDACSRTGATSREASAGTPGSSDIPGSDFCLPTSGHDVPGFTDAAGCGPNLRLVAPRGTRRAAALKALREKLGR